MEKENNKSTGITLSMILFIVFLILKLTGNINWSWWWVTSPLWIPYALIILVFFLGIIVGLLKTLL
jgi:membrane protein YdbS with pleckstrin-like domain